MKTAAILSMIAGLVASVAATEMPASDVSYLKGTKVEVFPDGLPKHLIPRALDLEKRDNVGVYLCNDRNFSGFCKHIVAPLYKRGMSFKPLRRGART